MSEPPNESPITPDLSAAAQLRSRLERLVSGSAPSDPLYLSNRSSFQKARFWIVLAVPCLAIAGAILFLALREPPQPIIATSPTNAEIAAKILPDLKNLQVPVNKDVELVGAVVNTESRTLNGSVRNRTQHVLKSVELSFYLTDGGGSQVGSVSAKVENVAANATARFVVPLHQKTAGFALVREIRAR